MRKHKVTNEKFERDIHEHFPFEDLMDQCELWREFKEDSELLSHSERMGIATNLLWVKGGRKAFFEGLESGVYDIEKWEHDCNYFVKKHYNAMSCERFCPHAATCEHAKNMIEQVTLPKGMVRTLKCEPRITVEEAEKKYKEAFEYALSSPEKKIFAIRACTGIGKTEMYTSIKNATIAVPTHRLKDEVALRMKVKFTATPKMPENKHLSYLYRIGNYKTAYQHIRQLAQSGNKEYKDYRDSMRAAERATGTILTTHNKLLSLEHSNNTIIIDEDIIGTLLQFHKTTVKDLETMAEQCNYFDSRGVLNGIAKYAKEACNGLVYPMRSYGFDKTSRLEQLVSDNKISSNVLGFLNCDFFVKYKNEAQEIINFIVKRQLPEDKKIIILSATINEKIYKMLFGDRLEFIDIGEVETKGNIIQYPQKSFSRHSFKENEDIILLAKGLAEGKPTISYKKFQNELDCVATFGATSGLDSFKGKNIAVIGTPHANSTAYLLIANALGKKPKINDTTPSMKYVKIRRNGFEFYFNTFSDDPVLQEIQLYLIESELMQAIGRSRILREDCTVTVLSNLPIKGAEYRYFTQDEAERIIEAEKKKIA